LNKKENRDTQATPTEDQSNTLGRLGESGYEFQLEFPNKIEINNFGD